MHYDLGGGKGSQRAAAAVVVVISAVGVCLNELFACETFRVCRVLLHIRERAEPKGATCLIIAEEFAVVSSPKDFFLLLFHCRDL